MAYSAISTASGPPPPDFDAFSYVFQEKLLLVAAESLDSSSTRLCRLADSACVQLRASFATVLSTLSSHASEAKQAMRRLQRSRGVWLGKQLEEVDASEKALESCARLCLCTGLFFFK